MTGDYKKADKANKPVRQFDYQRKRDHAKPNSPDHLQINGVEVSKPGEVDQRRLNENQNKTSREKKVARCTR